MLYLCCVESCSPLSRATLKALRADKLTEVDLSGKRLGPAEALRLGEARTVRSIPSMLPCHVHVHVVYDRCPIQSVL